MFISTLFLKCKLRFLKKKHKWLLWNDFDWKQDTVVLDIICWMKIYPFLPSVFQNHKKSYLHVWYHIHIWLVSTQLLWCVIPSKNLAYAFTLRVRNVRDGEPVSSNLHSYRWQTFYWTVGKHTKKSGYNVHSEGILKLLKAITCW